MKRARILWQGKPMEGVVEDEVIVLAHGVPVLTSEAIFLPPVQPRQIIATHLTYRSRCEEYKMNAPPAYPSYFMKPLGAVSQHKATVARPRGCEFLNYEGEIVAVIGKRCSNVPLELALNYVKGFTVANDFGVHDFRHADRGAMFRVKGEDGFCPLGPYMVDTTDIDPANLWLRTFVNGKKVQEAHTGTDLIFSAAYQIADISRLITLEENDILLTGTPAHSRPVNVGDVVAVEVEGICRLENTIVELDRDLVPIGDQPRITDQTLHVALAMPEEEARDQVTKYQSGDRRNR